MSQQSGTGLFLSAILRVGVLVGSCAWGAQAGWWQLWLFLALVILLLVLNLTVTARHNRVLLRLRSRLGPFEKSWDRVILALLLFLSFAIFFVAGLDVLRYGWSRVSWEWMVAGSLMFVIGDVIVVWCMSENPFLEPTVRVQA